MRVDLSRRVSRESGDLYSRYPGRFEAPDYAGGYIPPAGCSSSIKPLRVMSAPPDFSIPPLVGPCLPQMRVPPRLSCFQDGIQRHSVTARHIPIADSCPAQSMNATMIIYLTSHHFSDTDADSPLIYQQFRASAIPDGGCCSLSVISVPPSGARRASSLSQSCLRYMPPTLFLTPFPRRFRRRTSSECRYLLRLRPFMPAPDGRVADDRERTALLIAARRPASLRPFAPAGDSQAYAGCHKAFRCA